MSAGIYLDKGKLERLLSYLNERREIDDKIRELLTEGVTSEPTPYLKIPDEGWVSYSTKKAAEPDEDAWRFATTRDGDIIEAAKSLAEAIDKAGKVERDGFIYTRSKNGKFLQRRRKK